MIDEQAVSLTLDDGVVLDGRLAVPTRATIGLAVALALVSLVVVGLLPAWKIAQQQLIEAIKDGGQTVSRALDRTLLRRVMVAAQVAGSCLLLIVAGMMIRTVQRAIDSSATFDYQRAAALSMPLGRYGIKDDAARSSPR